jgi:serine O-acetyltransferase
MRWSLKIGPLTDYIVKQLNILFPDGNVISPLSLSQYLPHAMERTEYCFSRVRRKYFYDADKVVFNHLHSDHYSMFLYLLSNTIHKSEGDEALSAKLFLLNKVLHGVDVYFTVNLPNVFLFIHPVGTVIGNAKYSDYFVIYQNCGVGSDEDGKYPSFGEGVVLYASSKVIGDSHIGNNVVIGADSFVLNTSIPDSTVVLGKYPSLRLIPNSRSVQSRCFQHP